MIDIWTIAICFWTAAGFATLVAVSSNYWERLLAIRPIWKPLALLSFLGPLAWLCITGVGLMIWFQHWKFGKQRDLDIVVFRDEIDRTRDEHDAYNYPGIPRPRFHNMPKTPDHWVNDRGYDDPQRYTKD